MTEIRAARLDTIIDIEEPVDPPVRTASGAATKTWQSFATGIWSEWTGINGREAFAAGEYLSESFYQVKTRPVPGLNTKMRLVLGSRTFDILSMDDLGSRSEVWMRVKEGKSKGD